MKKLKMKNREPKIVFPKSLSGSFFALARNGFSILHDENMLSMAAATRSAISDM